MQFGILGPLEVQHLGQRVEVGPRKQRIVLGLLLCQAGRAVSVAALSEALWDDDPPASAQKGLQAYVCALRKTLNSAGGGSGPESGGIVHRPPGYALPVGPDQVDALRFRELVRAGRHALRTGDAAAAADALGHAVRLWRGPVLPDLVSVPAVAAEAGRLEDEYLAAYEDWAEAKLLLGDHAELMDGIDELARRHPLRERLRHAQMLALYRSGRQAEALAHFDTMRQLLARELGLRPSPVMSRLYDAILSGDASLDLPAAGAIRAGHRTEHRAAPAQRTRVVRDVADFVGRESEVDAVSQILKADGADTADGAGQTAGRTAVISGPAGVGKSALAVRCAHRLPETFPGGPVLTGLRKPDGRPRPVSDVLGDLLHGIGVPGTLPRGQQSREALLREANAERRALFVLDDAVNESQVRVLISATAGHSVLVTSRRRLGTVESAAHLVLDPLPDSDAVELLSRLIGAERVAAERAAAEQLARICGGLPLALRIAGVKLAALPHLPLARYAHRLTDERRLLDELATGDLRIRSRLKSWYRDLDPEEQATLRCLAFSPHTRFEAGDAAEWLGSDVPRTELAIERLVEAHLVVVEDHGAHHGADHDADLDDEVVAHSAPPAVRYALPPLVRVFLRESSSR